MSLECFVISFEKEVFFLLNDLNQQFRDSSLIEEPAFHDRITGEIFTL